VIAYNNSAKQFCTGANINVTANYRNQPVTTGTNRHLLENEAVRADPRIRVNDHTIRMRQKQSARYVAVEWYISTCHDAPKSVPNHNDFSKHNRNNAFPA
jgi:hypothetical protein